MTSDPSGHFKMAPTTFWVVHISESLIQGFTTVGGGHSEVFSHGMYELFKTIFPIFCHFLKLNSEL